MKYLIIGNSAASTAAVEAIRRFDGKGSVVQLTDEDPLLYSRCLLSYYLDGTLEKKGLHYRPLDFHESLNIELIGRCRVKKVDPGEQQVLCRDDRRFNYDRLLIATGSSAKIPPQVPKKTSGIHVLRRIEDAEAIRKSLVGAKNAVILGGGLIGMRAAQALRKIGLGVTVLIRSNHVLSQMIDEGAGRIIKEGLDKKGLRVLTGTDCTDVRADKGKIKAVVTDNGETLPCDLLIAAKGTSSNTELVHDAGIALHWGIVTDETMRTNIENIFAAGDAAETFDITTNEYTVNALWTCAVHQGRVAGLNMVDQHARYDGSLGMNALNLFDTSLIAFGLTSPKRESDYTILLDERPSRGIYKKIVIKDGVIKGIILVGRIDNAGILLSLIRNKTDVSSFAGELLDDRFNFGRLLKHAEPTFGEKYRDADGGLS